MPNAWAVPFAGGEPVQLTHSADPIHTPGYFPADERFLFSADRAGDELIHIYVRNPDGTVQDPTPGENVRALFRGWSAGGRRSQARSPLLGWRRSGGAVASVGTERGSGGGVASL